jgi:hypothetical protein
MKYSLKPVESNLSRKRREKTRKLSNSLVDHGNPNILQVKGPIHQQIREKIKKSEKVSIRKFDLKF